VIVTPFLRAIYSNGKDSNAGHVTYSVRTVFDFWMVGPSAIGSVKGTPSSITSRKDGQ
jgi:hypothetical protein